eukprot:9500575-Pyramimonas_sp.AAC.1
MGPISLHAARPGTSRRDRGSWRTDLASDRSSTCRGSGQIGARLARGIWVGKNKLEGAHLAIDVGHG